MSLDRRRFLNACSNLRFASTPLPGALFSLAAQTEDKRITSAMIDDADLTISGRDKLLYKDAETCAFAYAYQQAAGFLPLHPSLS